MEIVLELKRDTETFAERWHAYSANANVNFIAVCFVTYVEILKWGLCSICHGTGGKSHMREIQAGGRM
jgi:hypothetical protein